MNIRALSVLLVFLLLLSGGAEARAQNITGRILVAGDTVGVSGADVLLLEPSDSAAARVQSDDLGFFTLPAPAPGRYRILARRLGFATLRVDVEVGEREVVEVELRMAEEAIPLEPLIIVGRREIKDGTLDQFYDRMARMKQAGHGWFMTRAEIESSGAAGVPFLLARAPGVFLQPAGPSGYAIQMRQPGKFCDPLVFVDGLPASGFVPVMEDLEGIEVYPRRFQPVGGYYSDNCGMIFYWRKSDWGRPFAWGRLALAGGLVAAGFALMTIF